MEQAICEMTNITSDVLRWNKKYRDEIYHARVNANLMQYAHLLKRGRVLDLAGGLGQNSAWLASYSNTFRVINADLSEEGLRRAAQETARVVADAAQLPFPKNSFDTILNVRFYDARVRFSEWLMQGGTVFFETFTRADEKYRPDLNPAHRFDVKLIPHTFRNLKILHKQETDDGTRVYVTIIARKLF